MKLSEIKTILQELDSVAFQLEDGYFVPEHFHVTEIGVIDKKFIDCGGAIRHEQIVSFQLWDANDYDHRLKPAKLLSIISLSKDKLNIGDFEIEVEYQRDTIGKFGLHFNGTNFILSNKQTACLAADACGITAKERITLRNIGNGSVCTPGSGCC